MVVIPGMGRFDAALASIASSWRSMPGSPGLRRYASCPGGPSKTSVSMLDRARWKIESEEVIGPPGLDVFGNCIDWCSLQLNCSAGRIRRHAAGGLFVAGNVGNVGN